MSFANNSLENAGIVFVSNHSERFDWLKIRSRLKTDIRQFILRASTRDEEHENMSQLKRGSKKKLTGLGRRATQQH